MKHKNIDDVAKELNCSGPTIRRRMEEFGYGKEFKKIVFETSGNKLLTIIDKDKLVKDLEELKFAKIVAEKYNITQSCVENAIEICKLDVNKYKISRGFNKSKYSKEIYEEAYGRLKTFRGVARELKIDKSTVKENLIKHKIINN